MGFSFGGLVAYEMACQLVANGHKVNLVGLLDTYLTAEKQLLSFDQIIHNFFRQSPSQLLEPVKSKINALVTADKYDTDFWPHIWSQHLTKLVAMVINQKVITVG